MLTLFAIPKAFHGHVGMIQRNAILSWTLLNPRPEIILLGDDEGTAEVAQEFNLKHVPEIGRNQFGTPLMSSLFEIAQATGQGPLFAYINADIILMDDFLQAIERVPFQRFMLTGQRWNLDVEEPLQGQQVWQTQIRDRVTRQGQREGPQAMDYFVFTRDTYTDIPPFAIGRLCWDNWMLYKALNLGIPLIDATEAIMAVHQNHDYNHHPEGRQGVFSGEEAAHNLHLLGGKHYTYFMLDLANWQITPEGLRQPAFTWQRLDRQLDMLPLARPRLKPIAGMLLNLLRQGNQLRAVTSKVRGIPARIISRLRV
jgi:hypothetical protein